jgi:hypothetical protein
MVTPNELYRIRTMAYKRRAGDPMLPPVQVEAAVTAGPASAPQQTQWLTLLLCQPMLDPERRQVLMKDSRSFETHMALCEPCRKSAATLLWFAVDPMAVFSQ